MANVFSSLMVLYGTRLSCSNWGLQPKFSIDRAIQVSSNVDSTFFSLVGVQNFPALSRNAHEPLLLKRSCVANFWCPFLNQPSTERRFSSKHRGLSLVPFSNNDKSSESGEEYSSALETVLHLYAAIKNQNIHEVSDVIGDECRCICNFFSFFQSFQGKQQVLDFFNYVIRILGNNIEFVVKPTIHNGMNIGVSWRLEWSKTHMPLGKGFSFYICQTYQGKVIIRNVEMFMEPLVHIEPFRLKILGYLMKTLENMSFSCKLTREHMKKVILVLLLMAIILLFTKLGLY